ncbi:Molecular chaperone DnaJ [Forsythia ovata]|uniref:Molecular chaperone DnaJ n=1 Tax=Forsythia ovata TaxID=205694 RepID=A0ABD1S7D2_9LAMI
MSGKRSKAGKNDGEKQLERDPYEVLGVNMYSTDQEIKSAYQMDMIFLHISWLFHLLICVESYFEGVSVESALGNLHALIEIECMDAKLIKKSDSSALRAVAQPNLPPEIMIILSQLPLKT